MPASVLLPVGAHLPRPEPGEDQPGGDRAQPQGELGRRQGQRRLSAHTYLGLNLAKISPEEIALNRKGSSGDAKANGAVAFAPIGGGSVTMPAAVFQCNAIRVIVGPKVWQMNETNLDESQI